MPLHDSARGIEEDVRTIRALIGPSPDETKLNMFRNAALDNGVVTAKYNILSFLPKALMEQFRRLANVYFLVVCFLMVIGAYVPGTFDTPLTPFTTIGPLVLILSLTLAKEAYEDRLRHVADHETNTRLTTWLQKSGEEKQIAWKDIRPGMVIKVEKKEEIPADMVPLLSSYEDGKMFIETANIDGETSLKIRNCPSTSEDERKVVHWLSASELARDSVTIEVEQPNPSIHTFEGTLMCSSKRTDIPLDSKSFLLRGSCLRNTNWIYGVVVYIGTDSKLIQNARDPPSKLSIMETQINLILFVIFAVYFIVVTAATIIRAEEYKSIEKYLWYICEHVHTSAPELFQQNCDAGSESYSDFAYWFTFFILFSNFIPISLYVTIEIINMGQAFFIREDIEMYDESQDVPAATRTSNMNGDLGQIEYIFSDKTGTLTCNEMKFRRCSVAGKIYGNTQESGVEDVLLEAPDSNADTSIGLKLSDLKEKAFPGADLSPPEAVCIKNFCECLSLCHEVVIEKEDGQIEYQAESPDEEALVRGAIQLGWEYKDKKTDFIEIEIENPNGENLYVEYQIMATIEFSSTRKRSSVLVKEQDRPYYKVLIKGADSVIIERTASDGFKYVTSRTEVERQLNTFAVEGLRTLVLAYRDLSEADAKAWLESWNEANTSMKDRQGMRERAASKLEKDLTIVGCTAIEDRLQDKVPQTIADLAKAGIKLWVLTGDKITTAIEIAKSCRLITQEMKQLHVNEELGSKVENSRVRPPSDSDIGDTSTDTPKPPTPQKVEELSNSEDAIHSSKANVKRWLEEAEEYLKQQENYVWTNCEKELKSTRESTGWKKILQSIGIDGPSLSVAKRVAHVALVIDGSSLLIIFEDPKLLRSMLWITCCCKSVVACRVSPKQKQEIVKMVKDGLAVKPITLAIGDGANDVGMIQEAQIGIGISGKEGRQAVNNSDFAIAQFRFLKRLLLVHGRWNYRRMARTVVYFFNKNIVITALIFFFVTMSAFSGQSAFEEWLYTAFNAVFLALQPFSLGIFDQDISARTALRCPQCYTVGREKRDLNVAVMTRGAIRAIIEGTIIYWCVYSAGKNEIWSENGNVAGLFVWGGTLYNALLTNMMIKATILHKSINKMMFIALGLQIIGYLGYHLFCGGGIFTLSG